MVVGIPKDQLPDREASLLQLVQAASKEDSVAVSPAVVTAVDSEADSAAVIEEASVVEEEASDTNPEAASAEEVGMVEDMVTAQHHPLMLLQVRAEAAAALAVHQSVVLSMALRARTAMLVGMALHVVAHMTTDPLIVAEAAVVVGSVIAVQEASLAVIASPSDLVTEGTGIGIDTAAGHEKMTMGVARGIMRAMATMIHAANGDISRLRHYIGFVGWVCFPISSISSPLLPG